jgi:elongator complex protein 2
MRVDEEETGGVGENFDPISVLSNTKTKYQNTNQEIKEPPVEEVLMCKTLWPESQKLYGHAHEVLCIAASHLGDMAASACKSKSEQYTSIIIWKIL